MVVVHAAWMATRKTIRRRRCRCCRKWYRPHRSAEGSQKSCSRACGRARRRLTARLRRERDLQDFRVEERRRQRECRRRRRPPRAGGKQAGFPPVSEGMSRAGLCPEAAELEGQILGSWDKSARMSRAGLRRDLQALLGRNRGSLGQGGTRDSLCHAQASFPKSLGF